MTDHILKSFDTELDRQILPDGSHLSRNPQASVELLFDLLPLRQTYANQGEQLAPYVSRQKELGLKYDGGRIGGERRTGSGDEQDEGRKRGRGAPDK